MRMSTPLAVGTKPRWQAALCIKSWTLVGEAIEALSAVEDANTSATGWIVGLGRHRAGRPHVHSGHRRRAGSASGLARRHAFCRHCGLALRRRAQRLAGARHQPRDQPAELDRAGGVARTSQGKERNRDSCPGAESRCPTFDRSCRRSSRRHAKTRLRTTMRRRRLRSSWRRRHWANGLMQPLRPPRLRSRKELLRCSPLRLLALMPRVDQRDAANADKPALAAEIFTAARGPDTRRCDFHAREYGRSRACAAARGCKAAAGAER